MREKQNKKQTLNYRELTDGYQKRVGNGMGQIDEEDWEYTFYE